MLSLLKKFTDKQKKKREKKRLHWFVLVGIFLAVASGYLLYATPVFTSDAEDILPSDDVVAFAEIKTSFCSMNDLEKSPLFCEKAIGFYTSFFGISPARVGQFADTSVLVWYKPLFLENKKIVQAQMFRVNNIRAARQFLTKEFPNITVHKQRKEGVEIYSVSPEEIVFFWRGWIIFASDDSFIDMLAIVQDKESAPLSSESGLFQYRTTTPFYAFFDTEAITPLLSGKMLSYLQPLFAFFPEFSVTGDFSSKGLTASVKAFSRSALPSSTDTEKGFPLLSALPEDNLLLFFGVQNMREEIEKTFGYFEETDPAFAFSFHEEFQKLVQKMFGEKISLENDIFPLLEGESIFTLYAQEEKMIPVILADTNDAEFLEIKQKKMLEAAKAMAADFVPRVLTHMLPDNTEIKEITACEDCVRTEEESIDDASLTVFIAEKEGGETRTISFGILEDVFAFSQNKNLTKDVLSGLQKNSAELSFPKKKEVLFFYPQALIEQGVGQMGMFSDFSRVLLQYETKDRMWTFSLEGEY